MRHQRICIAVVGIVICAIAAGCQTVRYNDAGLNLQTTTGWAASTPPEWAQHGGLEDPTGLNTFFVGVSQEKATTEGEAINQAYMDALYKVGDYIGFTLAGSQVGRQYDKTGADGRFPWRMSWRRSKFSQESEAEFTQAYETWITRDQVAGLATIKDTWTVQERYANPRTRNNMKSGAFWKAKVLLSVSRDELLTRAQREFEIRTREVDMKLDHAELQYDHAAHQAELQAQQAHMLSDLMLEYARQQTDLRLEVARMRHTLAEKGYEKRLELLDAPTFNFMTNAVWHGFDPEMITLLSTPPLVGTTITPAPFDAPDIERYLPSLGEVPLVDSGTGTHFVNYQSTQFPNTGPELKPTSTNPPLQKIPSRKRKR